MEKQAFDSPCRPRFSSDSSSGDDLPRLPAFEGGWPRKQSGSSEEADGEIESTTENPLDDSDKIDTNNKDDSGLERSSSPGSATDAPDFQIPSIELVARILLQVEFYFSDENVLKDAFLLKHVRRNKEGYVSLKLVASFRKVKSLSKNWQVVAYALKQSERLEVNDQGTKVRRRDPLPTHDETAPSRTVVAFNLPFDKPTVEGVGELFSKYGEIALIRILRPGTLVPPDIRRFLNKHPEVGNSICALVEFEYHSSASAAAEELDSKSDDPEAMRVLPVTQKTATGSSASDANKKQSRTKAIPAMGDLRKKEKKQPRVNQLKADESPVVSSSDTELSPVARRRSSSSSSGYLSSSPREYLPWRKLKELPETTQSVRKVGPGSTTKAGSKKSGRKTTKDPPIGSLVQENPGSVCPWVQKRIDGFPSSGPTMVPVCIIRQPKGPDATNGFNYTRVPIIPLNSAVLASV